MGKRGHPIPKGGIQQRLARAGLRNAAGLGAAHDALPSKLVQLLTSCVVWGEVSSPFAQKVCQAAVEDGLLHPDVVAVSKMGSGGNWPGKVYGQLMARLPRLPIFESLGNLKLPLKVQEGVRQVIRDAGALACLAAFHRACVI